MEDRDLDDKESVTPLLIYPEDSVEEENDPQESLSNPPSADPTLEPGPPIKEPAK